jgi:hypothetical protein
MGPPPRAPAAGTGAVSEALCGHPSPHLHPSTSSPLACTKSTLTEEEGRQGRQGQRCSGEPVRARQGAARRRTRHGRPALHLWKLRRPGPDRRGRRRAGGRPWGAWRAHDRPAACFTRTSAAKPPPGCAPQPRVHIQSVAPVNVTAMSCCAWRRAAALAASPWLAPRRHPLPLPSPTHPDPPLHPAHPSCNRSPRAPRPTWSSFTATMCLR